MKIRDLDKNTTFSQRVIQRQFVETYLRVIYDMKYNDTQFILFAKYKKKKGSVLLKLDINFIDSNYSNCIDNSNQFISEYYQSVIETLLSDLVIIDNQEMYFNQLKNSGQDELIEVKMIDRVESFYLIKNEAKVCLFKDASNFEIYKKYKQD